MGSIMLHVGQTSEIRSTFYPWFEQLGDEATAINSLWLFLIWTSDLAPDLTDSASSRMLIAIIPAERYAIDPVTGLNLTIQAACRHITQSMNMLSLHGVRLPSSDEDEPAS